MRLRKNATVSCQARGNFEPGCCPCPKLPRPMKCYVSCCTSNYFNIELNVQDTN